MNKRERSNTERDDNKLKRLLILDNLLHNPEGVTKKDILNNHEMDVISERTLINYLNELQEKVEMEPNLWRGKERLWRYKDIKVSYFDKVSKEMELISDSIEKLKALKGDPRYDFLKFYLLGLMNGVKSSDIGFMSFDNNLDAKGLEHIDDILKAITQHYPIKITYTPFDGKEILCKVHPYHLHQYNRRWHLYGYSEERKALHNWAIDRITDVKPLSKKFIPSDINFEEYFEDIIGFTNIKENEVKPVIIKIKKEKAGYYLTKPLHLTQKILKDRETDSHIFIQIDVKWNMELQMLLLSYGDEIEVVSPDEFRNKIKEVVSRMGEIYEV